MRYKVLFLAGWYPSRVNPVAGIFIKNHAEAVSILCDVAVFFVTADPNLKEKKYDADYSAENNIPTLRIYYRKSSAPLISKFINLYRNIKGYYGGLRILKQKLGRPDVIHVNAPNFYNLAASYILKKIKKIPFIVSEQWTGYSNEDGSFSRTPFIAKALIGAAIKKAQAVTAVSNALKNAMLGHGLINNYFVVPNAVRSGKDFYSAVDEINSDKKRIIHISLLNDEQKNLSGIIKAVKYITDTKRRDFELYVVGDGRDRGKLEELAKNYELLGKYIFFQGLKTPQEVPEELEKSDFLVMNSNYETFSVVAAEAIACGTPVIATKCGGPEDFVTEETGALIEPNNHKQLVDAILYMLDNCRKYDKKKLQEYAKDRFNYESVGKQFYMIYSYALYKKNIISSVFKFGNKKLQYYKTFLIKADNNLHEQVAVNLLEYQYSPASILDFGCGEGALSQRLNDIGFDVVSADADKSDFKADTTFEHIDFESFLEMNKFAEKYKYKFDIVLSIEVIEHLENIKLYLRTVSNVLKKGKILILTTPNPSSWLSRLFFLYKGIPHQFGKDDLSNYGHINPIFYIELEYLLGQEGFEILKVSPGGFLPRFWIAKNFKQNMLNIAGFLIYPLIKGLKDGWCTIVIARKI